MPLAVFSRDDKRRLGKVIDRAIIDLGVAAPALPNTVIDFLNAGEAALRAFAGVSETSPGRLDLAAVKLHAPVKTPEKYLAIGMNYGEHAKEAERAGIARTPHQVWFNKQVSCINDPFGDVEAPSVSDQLDYEGELGIVIGKTCRHVPVEDARDMIGGFLICNDVSVRDWQRRTPTMTLGKSFDTHGPIGPWLTLNHELQDPMALRIRTFVNGEERQNETTAAMIHNIYEQIAYLSTVMTLKTGDVLATGTPSGVGAARTPPSFVRAGDIMRVEIEPLGFIENRVAREA